MYVKVRTMDGKMETILTISKLTEVEDFKREIEKEFHIEAEYQRLFFRGKQLEDGYKLYDYNINLNDVIQLIIKEKISDTTKKQESENKSGSSSSINTLEIPEAEEENLPEGESLYYKVGDAIDCLDQEYGAWFEALVLKILKKDEEILYNVKWEFDDKAPPFTVLEKYIRPRSHLVINFNDLKMGQTVLVNHNVDSPKDVGLWYDFTIKKLEKKRNVKEMTGKLHIGRAQPLDNHKISLKCDVFAIEEPKLIAERSVEDESHMTSTGKKRQVQNTCSTCMDNPRRKCKDCGCKVCGGKEDEHNLLLCDECNLAYHLKCLDPPLTSLPEEEYWYCPECKNDENEIVKAGDKKQAKKKTSKNENSNSKRDWGKGMACVGRTKECSLVPPNHRGPIPGVEVGMCWIFRVQVSEVGVHRPHVAGIHGRETDCAYSLVLSGGYEDDIDNGDEFMYTGSGGRDLSGNKRTAEQSCDQTLTRMNKALAMNCKAKLNAKVGATAEDWKGGIPVRVVRNFKLAKHSKYAPKEGNRYDGIYKVVKYYPDTGKSGFRVWRYMLRRDDPAPAPWTKEGKERSAALGLKPTYPEGYLEAKAKKETPSKKQVTLHKSGKTTKLEEPPTKKQKLAAYELETNVIDLINEDNLNTKLWAECRTSLVEGKSVFLQRVRERFTCPCCLELVYKPVTTSCSHNICYNCMKRSFSSGVNKCPSCRHALDKNYNSQINKPLSSALSLLYPGYEAGR